MTTTIRRRCHIAAATLAAITLLGAGCRGEAQAVAAAPEGDSVYAETPDDTGLASATFAGGCFWCMEQPFDEIDGVLSTTSGYAGGEIERPTYEQVAQGETKHAEVLRVVYDPEKVTYEELLHVFWRNIDPLAVDRQFCDRGRQYRSGIFYHDESQKRFAEESRDAIAASGKLPGEIVTEITPLRAFYPAETYHQDYYVKNPSHYKRYRVGCGRDRRLAELWGGE